MTAPAVVAEDIPVAAVFGGVAMYQCGFSDMYRQLLEHSGYT